MSNQSALGHFFSLDVLDGQQRKKDPTKKLRWQTLEFYVYYLAFIVVVPIMFYSVIVISRPSHPNYPLYQHLLEDGFGRKVDNSDTQYASFRNQIPTLAVVTVGHVALRWVFDQVVRSGNNRIRYDLAFGMIFLFVMHGTGALKLLLISTFTYNLAKRGAGTMLNPTMTWLTVIGLLFLNEAHQGYKFTMISPSLAPLDQWSGLQDRWHIHFNITALRLISFNLDYYWSRRTPIKQETSKKAAAGQVSEKVRIETPAASEDYSYGNFLAYVFYSPLYLAGPIITFNNYLSQTVVRPDTITLSRTVQYALRLLVSVITMEFVLHFIYVVAMSKAHAWENLSPLQISMLGYFNLHIIWLKLLIPWRFFRLWAMMDGVETTENMIRCMSNNYSALAFWRAWHRSFNRWILRYIYIPLSPPQALPAPPSPATGSGKRKGGRLDSVVRTVLNMLCVFTFVALWHDISLTLLTWGWLVVLFLVPELVLTRFAAPYRSRGWYRYLSSVGAVGTILSMMAANLVGFCVGLEGLGSMVALMFGSVGGFFVLAASCASLFVGVQIMFEVREDEAARGINLRC
ncbi:protein of unknown function [Taphrina deformans PYCC 5710]|uniref:Glycerol:H+ symporter n=1 Tax=Taphrina deformans (strain PYCC 5710 / ATCC 11124 / CBS 356.35 / IMI 108563 / JCM 9778 / NBRC 8474) TaxID=1097556 RepID=R4XFM6_TAPDE|nr:protein of unknown function [Taphrina deformans PYCC 5710]|eukprot:CCG84651.1 protein of unknown function [Taphrina deformans PYCC 5710]